MHTVSSSFLVGPIVTIFLRSPVSTLSSISMPKIWMMTQWRLVPEILMLVMVRVAIIVVFEKYSDKIWFGNSSHISTLEAVKSKNNSSLWVYGVGSKSQFCCAFSKFFLWLLKLDVIEASPCWHILLLLTGSYQGLPWYEARSVFKGNLSPDKCRQRHVWQKANLSRMTKDKRRFLSW